MTSDEHAGFTKFGIPRWRLIGNQWEDSVTNKIVAEKPNKPDYREEKYKPLSYLTDMTTGEEE